MKIDLGLLRDLKTQGLISTERHRELPLLNHNYATRCQWENAWDELTLQCRGLITDTAGNVISRPFPKFFNLAQHEAAALRLPPINGIRISAFLRKWMARWVCSIQSETDIGLRLEAVLSLSKRSEQTAC
jgi:hypothetical protein